MSTFDNYIQISEALQDSTVSAIRAAGFDASFGCSNVSCSRYVEVRLGDDDETEAFKIRFSDHDDRYGSDLTIRFDRHIDEVEDDFGDIELEIADWRMDDMVAEAVTAALEHRA